MSLFFFPPVYWCMPLLFQSTDACRSFFSPPVHVAPFSVHQCMSPLFQSTDACRSFFSPLMHVAPFSVHQCMSLFFQSTSACRSFFSLLVHVVPFSVSALVRVAPFSVDWWVKSEYKRLCMWLLFQSSGRSDLNIKACACGSFFCQLVVLI